MTVGLSWTVVEPAIGWYRRDVSTWAGDQGETTLTLNDDGTFTYDHVWTGGLALDPQEGLLDEHSEGDWTLEEVAKDGGKADIDQRVPAVVLSGTWQ